MINRAGQRLNRAKKFLLASAGVAVLAGPVMIGVAIGVGHVPAVRAQSPLVTPAAAVSPDRRLVAMLFDFATMTSAEQSQARQGAIDFVHNRMGVADRVALMAVDNGKTAIVEDFTDNRLILESAILRLSPGSVSSSAPGAGIRLQVLEAAARLLAVIPEKKALMYFTSGPTPPVFFDQAEFLKTIDIAKKSNVAFYKVDVRGSVPLQSPPAGPSQEEYNRRLAYVQEKFGSASTAMARTYLRYGPPDHISDHIPTAPDPSQIWRYNYLESFHNNVEFVFGPGNGPNSVRITWPPPLATYEGAARGSAALADSLRREFQSPGGPAVADTIPGLPGRHASFKIYPAGEPQTLSVPLDALSGQVEILSQIKTRVAGAEGQSVAAVRDTAQASADTFQANFILQNGSYVCGLIVREKATGRMYEEMIDFEVK